jgi:CPA2 family monovalent cation:H+ antiporter-2
MEFALLKDIVIIFALSTFVNLLFTRMKVPTVVGYLITGVLAGPHLLKLVTEQHQIELIAEIGVVLLLFGIGMEFSLKHLFKIRKVVFLGGLMQVSLSVGIFYLAAKFMGLSNEGSLFMGFLAALSSSALVLKLLQERSELTSNYGRTILGILIFQDLLLVPLILFTNVLGNDAVDISDELYSLLMKAAIIIALVFVGNKWLFPRLLHFIALAKNQELFMMSIFLICLAIALLTSEMGMSLAFGAFLAGLMISESEYSHNAFGNLIPLKDTFTSFFFVSIGMLLDVSFVIDNYILVIESLVLVLVVKSLVAGATGFMLGHTFRGTILIGLALSQVGEFSFVLAKIGTSFSLLSPFYYQLFLAVAVITMAITPFLMWFSRPLSTWLLRLPIPKFMVYGLFPLKEMELPAMQNHLVIIGKDSSAQKLSSMANYTGFPHVSIIFDPVLARERQNLGDTVIYGDAVNEPILTKANVQNAEVVVVSVGDLIPAMAIIEKVRNLNRNVFIIARAKHIDSVEQLYNLGADQVLPEKLEIAIELFYRVLTQRLVPKREVNQIISHIRSDYLGIFNEKDLKNKPSILDELINIEISAVKIERCSQVDGLSIRDIGLRQKTGVTLLAIKRGKDIIEHPEPDTRFICNDVAYILGTPEQLNSASELFSADGE